MRSHIVLGGIFCLSLLVVLRTCQRSPKSATVNSSPTTTTGVAVSEPMSAIRDEDSTASELDDATIQASADVDQSPVAEQIAKLTAADPQAQINVRSQPSSASEPVGYGQVGETVVLNHAEAGVDGYIWHRVTFQSDDTTGWIRSDLLDIQPAAAGSKSTHAMSSNPSTSKALERSLNDTCGSTRAIEAHFVTASNTIYICKVRNRRTYLSQEAGTEQVVQAEDVEALDSGYIIGNDNFEYRLDASNLVVVRLSDSGRQEEVLREPVIHSERY